MITEVLPGKLVSTLATVPWAGPRVLFRLQNRGLGFATVTWPEFAALVARDRPVEVSVDVYDTCLIRDLAGGRPIEEAILHRSATGPDTVSAGDHAEALEWEVCRPVPGARQALATIRAVVGAITFVSDTDRSAALLTELLRDHDLFVDGDRLFASCEEGATKSDGDLFARIWPDADPRTVWHLGNNPWADGTMAAAAGLRPYHLAEADLDRYESIMARSATSEGPVIAGAARRARLEVIANERSGALGDRQARARVVGAGVGGQVLSAFNLWLGHQARSFDLAGLGYLARDGELPLRMARAMPPDHWSGIDLRYLHCSRVSWGLASASAVGVDAWLRAGRSDACAFLLTQRHDVPISSLLARVGLTPEDLGRLGQQHRSLAGRPMEAALPAEADGEWQDLLGDDRVAELIEQRSEVRRSLVIDYLAGEQVLERRMGLVDVGWRGRLAWHISSVLRSVDAPDPVHLHFGGDKVIDEVDRAITIRRFAFQGDGAGGGGQNGPAVASPVVCVETLTASGKPRVVEYRRRDDGSVDLVYSSTTGDNVAADGDRADLWHGALAVAAALPARTTLTGWGVRRTDLDAEVRCVLARWWNAPATDEVASIAHIQFEHDEAGSSFHPLAAPYSWEEVARGAGSRRAWVRGSEVMTPWSIRLAVNGGRRVRDTLERMRR